ncbi:MAG: hypothetical protein CL610_28800 [Anaerolineaceae bacterium]|nr:hypothetical protein [Anaerolineaceae bacterium]
MKICPKCHFKNREGFMFCEDCGENLVQVPSMQTRLYESIAEPQEPTLALQVLGQSIPLKLRSQTLVGRSDPDRPHQPDVDLTHYEAFEKGVSSLHAIIQHSVDGVQIIDMSSTNGTYVNGRRMVPNQHYVLLDGDEIRFGRLVTRIVIAGLT